MLGVLAGGRDEVCIFPLSAGARGVGVLLGLAVMIVRELVVAEMKDHHQSCSHHYLHLVEKEDPREPRLYFE
jgi:hypothetical protein